jgi:tetratricopeptide (TPR) repeat protein
LRKKKLNSPEEVNACLQSLMPLSADSELLAANPETPLEQARELVDQATDETSPRRRISLAKRALEVCADCADAYLLLAEETPGDLPKKRDLFDQALQAALRTLGPEAFRNYVGHFWGAVETRPYMRARAGLAECLWALGERAAAIAHCWAMLELNPNDNQGNRNLLSDWLLAEQRDDELGGLLKKYPDDCQASWLYNRALWLFRKHGPGFGAQEALRQARDWNPFVPPFLLGQQKLPSSLPPFIALGQESEAAAYAMILGRENWRNSPSALAWLRMECQSA